MPTPGKTGKLSPRMPVGVADLADYMTGGLPVPPPNVQPPAVQDWGMCDNDTYGCCTISGAIHVDENDAALVGTTFALPSFDDIKTTYFGLTGGQDTGLVEYTVLDTWRTQGLFGRKIAAFAPIHPNHFQAMRFGIAAYGSVYVGVQLPENAMQQFQNGQPWELAPGSNPGEDGHCIILVGYDAQYLYAVTWGAIQPITWNWWQAYGDEAYVVISQEFVQANKLPDGMNLAALQSDLQAVSRA